MNEDFPIEFESLVIGERYSFFLTDCCVEVHVIDAEYLGKDIEDEETIRYRFNHINVLRAYNSTMYGLVSVRII